MEGEGHYGFPSKFVVFSSIMVIIGALMEFDTFSLKPPRMYNDYVTVKL